VKRILFVEDDEVLRTLYSHMLSDEKDQWEVSTAGGGETAVNLLRESAFDVVVSDMQMPGMSGIELLTEVRNLHPQTSRIIISGSNDQAVAADSLNCTHLFIPKPFGVKTLKATLHRITSLDAYLKDDKLRGLAGKMRELPSFPMVYMEIIQELDSPDASVEKIASIISKDPAITTKILQVANSVAFGLRRTVSDPMEAVQQLGLLTVRSLALSAQVFSSFKPARLKHFSPDTLWSHLMKCGELARRIMRHERADRTEAEDAFTAGMLHDIGALMLADSLPGEFDKALATAASEHISLPEAELRIFGATHTGLAAYLFGLWGLPASIVEAAAFHHAPQTSDLKKFSALTAVHVANAICDPTESGNLDFSYLEQIGKADRVNAWREVAAEMETQK